MSNKIHTSTRTLSISSSCHGVADGYAICERTNKKAYANKVTKADGPFYCPDCLSEVIVRKCTDKDDHFAHKFRQSPAHGPKSQKLHTKCKEAICKVMQDAYPDGKWQTERPIDANHRRGTPKIVPDISGRVNNKPVAIEVQLSPYTIDKIREKTENYARLGIAVLWIVPLYEPLESDFFRPRMYETYLHTMYYGKVYYWLADSPEYIIPVHFGIAKRFIKQSSWLSPDGNEMSAGGFFLAYKSVKKPEFHPDIAFSVIKDFTTKERPKHTTTNTRRHIPKCQIFMDNKTSWWNADEQTQAKNLIKRNNIQTLQNYSYEEE